MKRTTKAAALVLAAIMSLTSLAGCSKSKSGETVDEYVYKAEYFDLKDFEGAQINSIAVSGEKLYALVNQSTGETVENSYIDENGEEQSYTSEIFANVLYEINAATGEMKKLEGYVDNISSETDYSDPAVQKYSSVSGMTETANGGLAVIYDENTTIYNLPADFNQQTDSIWNYSSTSKYVCRVDILDENGGLVETKTVAEKESGNGEYYSIYKIVCDKDGNWYALANGDSIEVYNPDFSSLLFTLNEERGFGDMVRIADGSVAVLLWDNSGNQQIKVIDLAKKDFSAGANLSMSAVYFNQIFTGSGEYDFFGADQSGILGVNAKDGTVTRIVDWLDCDLSPDYVQHVSGMENGDFVLYNQDWDNNTSELVRLVKTLNDPSNEKKIITVATAYMNSDMRDMVAKFNKTNTEYRMKVTDYSQYATNDDYTAGITKLNTEIIAGKVPDIIVIDGNLPITQYAAKGILEDLTPYIERDFGKDALVEDFFKTLRSSDGKLYEVYSAFSLQTALGLKSVVGDAESWTFEDMKNALAKLPEGADIFGRYYSRSSALYTFLYSNMEKFVNWETGECSFDSPEFIDLLETVKTFPADEDVNYDDYEETEREEDRIRSGKQLLANVYMWNLQDFRLSTFYTYGKDISFVGYPGTGSTFTSSGVGYAISSKSEYKDVAWEFISRILTKEYQEEQNQYGYYNGIPTNKEVFEDMMTKEATPEFNPDYSGSSEEVVYGENGAEASVGEGGSDTETGKKTVFYEGATNAEGVHETPKTTAYFGNDDEGIDVYAMTDYEKEIILDLIKNTKVFMRYDTSLSDIINEEIQPFFKGEKSAAEAAKMIQSRAGIYINEQR